MKRPASLDEPEVVTPEYNIQEDCANDFNEDEDDKAFSRALMKLSFVDRSAIEEEIHGVSCMAPEETPELLEESLANFESELESFDPKPGYDRAQELLHSNSATHSVCYLDSKEFRLRFLRAEFFDCAKAVSRFVRCFDFLREYFGEYALRRPIRLSDFNKDEMSFLREGQYQIFPYRDRSGRRIYTSVVNNRNEVPKRVLCKTIFYLWYVMCGGSDISNNDSNNIETHRKGVVNVIFPSRLHMNYNDGKSMIYKAQFARFRAEVNAVVASVVPIRVASIHLCFPKTMVTKIISVFASSLVSWQSRTKVHLGDPLEIRYKLQQFGIPVELIPATDTGNIKSVNLKQWIKLRRFIEREEQDYISRRGVVYSSESDGGGTISSDGESLGVQVTNVVECPLTNDVIFRRGKSMNYHPGNAMFQNLIEMHIQEHTIDPNTSQARRIEIEKELVDEIRKKGGRFLKWEIDKAWWVDMDSNMNPDSEKEILSKVHYAFRDFRKKMLKAKQATIANESGTYAFERLDGGRRKRRNDGSTPGFECCDNAGPASLLSKQVDFKACGFFFSTDGSLQNLNGM